MNAFAANPWFRSLPPHVAEALLEATVPVQIAAGAFLIRQGDPLDASSHAFFGVASGALKLSIFNADGDEAILTLVEPGNWFGGVSTLDQQPRGHCAIALEDSEVLAVSVARFEALLRDAAFAGAIAGWWQRACGWRMARWRVRHCTVRGRVWRGALLHSRTAMCRNRQRGARAFRPRKTPWR